MMARSIKDRLTGCSRDVSAAAHPPRASPKVRSGATRLIGREPLITFVTFGELAEWAEIRNWGERHRGELVPPTASQVVGSPGPPRTPNQLS